jgi:hypothetical protein
METHQGTRIVNSWLKRGLGCGRSGMISCRALGFVRRGFGRITRIRAGMQPVQRRSTDIGQVGREILMTQQVLTVTDD